MRQWLISIVVFFAGCVSIYAQDQPLELSPELKSLYEQFRIRLIEQAAGDHTPAIELFQQTRDAATELRFGDAVRALEVLAGRQNGRGEGGYRTWLRLTIALQQLNWARITVPAASDKAAEPASSDKPSVPADGGDRAEPTTSPLPSAESVAAAYGAYVRATTEAEQRESLLLLGGILAKIANDDVPAEDQAYAGAGPEVMRQIYTEIGALASHSGNEKEHKVFADETERKSFEALAPKAFELNRLLTPIPPEEAACPDPQSVRNEAIESVQIYGKTEDGPETLPVECISGERHYTCIEFNKNLDPDPSNINSIVVRQRSSTGTLTRKPQDFLLAIRDRQICFGDLQLGLTYTFEIPAAFKSAAAAGGTTIGTKLTFEWQTPNRPLSLGFQRGARIMSVSGARVLSLKAVNVARAKVELRRIGDLQLMRDLVLNNVTGGAASDQTCELTKIGELIADGTVTIGKAQNTDIEVPVPVGDIIDARNLWLSKAVASSFDPQPFNRSSIALKLHGDAIAAGDPQRSTGIFVLLATMDSDRAILSKDDTVAEVDTGCPDRTVAQWLVVTNIGLTVQVGRKQIYAVARALDSGAAIRGAKVEFVSASGSVLGVAETDAMGVAQVDARLGRGKGGNKLAAAIVYDGGKDVTFLDMASDAVTLGDRGFDGRVAPTNLDAFVAPARGIYRPGETLQALVMVRTPEGEMATDLPPIEASLSSAGREIGEKKILVDGTASSPGTPQNGGGYFVEFAIPDTQRDGVLKVEVRAAGQPIGSAEVEVRFFRPDTVNVSFDDKKPWSGTLSPDGHLSLSGSASAHFLYGLTNSSGFETSSAAANLRTEVDVTVEPAATPFGSEDAKYTSCYGTFSFGRKADEFQQRRFRIPALSSDSDGTITVSNNWDGVAQSDAPLQATVSLSVVDAVGRAAAQKTTVALRQVGRNWIGLRAVPPATLQPDEPTEIEIIALDSKFQPIRDFARLQLSRRQHALTWQEDGTSWDFVDDHSFSVPVGGPEQVELNPQAHTAISGSDCGAPTRRAVHLDGAGTYIVQVTLGDTVSELEISKGSSTDPDGKLRPDKLLVFTQPKNGDLNITVDSPHETGWLLGEVVSRGIVVDKFEKEIKEQTAQTKISMAGWPSGRAHVYATSFRAAKGDSREKGPARAIGGAQFTVGESPGAISVDIRNILGPYEHASLKDGLSFDIAADGVSADAWVTVAAVDEGVLSLTDFATPDPQAHYFGNRRLQLDVFDTYGRIIFDQKAGGDTVLREVRGSSYRSNQIVSFHSGILHLDKNGRASITIPGDQFPESFQGSVRLMAWVWDAHQVAARTMNFSVRDSVIVRLHAPEYMAPGDLALVPLTVRNLDSVDVDKVQVEVRATAPVELSTEEDGSEPCDGDAKRCRRFDVPAKLGMGEKQALVAITSGNETEGAGKLTVTSRLLRSDSSVVAVSSYDAVVAVRPPWPHAAALATLPEPIAPGQSLTINEHVIAMLAGDNFRSETLQVSPRLSRTGLQPLTQDLDETFAPMRRLDDLTEGAQALLAGVQNDGQLPPAAVEKLDKVIRRIETLQDEDGGFVSDAEHVETFDTSREARPVKFASDPKSPDVGETAFALDLLIRAKRSGASVSEDRIDLATGYLLAAVNQWHDDERADWGDDGKDCSRGEFYSLVILSRLGRVTGRNIDYFEQSCDSVIKADPTRRLLMAAAYGAFGRLEDAKGLFNGREGDAPLSELASKHAASSRFQAVALLMENAPSVTNFETLVKTAGLVRPDMTTDKATESWLARATSAFIDELRRGDRPAFRPDTLACDGAGTIVKTFYDGADLQRLRSDDLRQKSITCVNRGSEPLYATFLLEGTPAEPLVVKSMGLAANLSVERATNDDSGALVLKQYEPAYLFVEISPTTPNSGPEQLAAVQILPPGFEVVDRSYRPSWANLVGDRITVKSLSAIDYSEVLADRWISLPSAGEQRYLLAFSIRPTLQGRFILPPLSVYDLKDPRRATWTASRVVVVRPAD